MRYTWSGKIASAHPALAGHFPGNPVVPGVVLLSRVMHAAEQGFGPDIKIVAVPATKFSAVLRPGEKFDVSLEIAGDRLIRFVITRGETRIASGSLRATLAFADETATAAALWETDPSGEFRAELFPLTVQLSVNLIRNTNRGTLTAEAQIVHRGRTTVVVEVKVFDAERRLVATLVATQLAPGAGSSQPPPARTS